MLKRRYTYGVHENCLIFNTHYPQSIYVQNISALLILDVQFLNKPSYPLEQTMEQKPYRACERTKLKQKQIQVTSHSNWPRISIYPKNNAMVSLKDGFTVWHQSQ